MEKKNESGITRRDALKRMGGILAGLALTATPLGALSSCAKEKKRIVFFFTGTGNSLYIAKQFGENLLSIPQVMKGTEREFEADEIGLVYPVYYFSLPRNVEEFLSKVKLKADYLFCLQTYSTSPGDATEYLRYHAAQNGIHFHYVKSIHMPSNFLPYFDVQSEENLSRANDTPKHLAEALADINEQKRWIEPVPDMPEEWKRKDFSRSPEVLDKRSETLFCIDPGRCIGCGICSRICPKGNYTLDGMAKTSGKCLYCLSCANACPQKAITVLPDDVNPSHRYINPHVTIPQIIKANQQK